MASLTNLSEPEYRKLLKSSLDRIEKAFSEVDPDVAECEQSQGALTITFPDRSRCILSAQPSVRQLWLALAAKGTAYHFNYDATRDQWVDDKGKGIELMSFLDAFLTEKTGLSLGLNVSGKPA